jgi:hypothetical protein
MDNVGQEGGEQAVSFRSMDLEWLGNNVLLSSTDIRGCEMRFTISARHPRR